MPYIVLDPTAAQAAPSVTSGAPETSSQHPFGKSLDHMAVRLRLELGNRSTTDLPNSVVYEWINDAYQDLYSSLSLPESKLGFQIATVADQPLYMLPAVVDTIRSISGVNTDTTNVDGDWLREMDVPYYRKLPDESGPPTRWLRDNMLLVLWPTPDDVYDLSLDCRGDPQKLVNPDDYPALEDKWHEALYKAAKYRAWEGLQQDARSLTTMNEMSRLIKRKNDRDADDKAESYPSMRPVFRHQDIARIHSSRRRREDD